MLFFQDQPSFRKKAQKRDPRKDLSHQDNEFTGRSRRQAEDSENRPDSLHRNDQFPAYLFIMPDRVFGRTAANQVYIFPATMITEQGRIYAI